MLVAPKHVPGLEKCWVSPEDRRGPDSAPSTFWASENLVQLLGLLKDLEDLTLPARALQLAKNPWLPELLPAHLPKARVGIVSQPVAAPSDLQEVEQEWRHCGQSPREVPPLLPCPLCLCPSKK